MMNVAADLAKFIMSSKAADRTLLHRALVGWDALLSSQHC